VKDATKSSEITLERGIKIVKSGFIGLGEFCLPENEKRKLQ
jgi:hypothetical protein